MFHITRANNAEIYFGPCPEKGIEIFIANLVNARINCVVSLLQEDEQKVLGLEDEGRTCYAHNIEFSNFPIPDQGIPGFKRFVDMIEHINDKTTQRSGVYVHCRHGIGRSSMVVAGLLVRAGIPLIDALNLIETKRGKRLPETLSQKKLLVGYDVFIKQKAV